MTKETYDTLVETILGWSPDNNQLQWEWTTHGESGGSCWGDESRPYSSDESEPDKVELEKILSFVAPNITIFQYREIERELFVREDWSRHEYYGNWDAGMKVTINLDKLYDFLKERKLMLLTEEVTAKLLASKERDVRLRGQALIGAERADEVKRSR